MPRDTALGNPAVHPDEDEFNRWPFSRALADRIAGLGNAEGAAVIGLYGKWGSGKSTVLNFIKYHLEHEHASKVVLFEFNPWFFTSQEQLLAAFFTGLASRLEQSLGSPVKDAGALLNKYSGLFGMIPVVGSGASRLAEQLGNELSANSLQNQRERVFDMMRTAQRTTVVLIDDLDRLDRAEIVTMLKLVRLTANLPRVVYLLAFDDQVVAQVVASGNAVDVRDAGRQFLEKIVQFPFTLPAVGQKRLVDYVLRQAHNATDRAGISLSDQEWSAFRNLTDYHLSRRLTTPRQAIRYASALDFALPMVKGEVNPLQQMVVEGMRILFPELYVYVRDNSVMFNLSLREEASAKLAARAMESAREEDISAGTQLLLLLFQEYHTPQSIADPRYFDRYFGYALAPDEISDIEMSSLLAHSEAADDMSVDVLIKQLAARNAELLLRLLSQRQGVTVRPIRMSAKQITVLAPALAGCGSLFATSQPLEADFKDLLVGFVQEFADFASQRYRLAADIVSRIEPLGLALVFIKAIRRLDFESDVEAVSTGSPREPIIGEEGWPVLHQALLLRVRKLADREASNPSSDVLLARNFLDEHQRFSAVSQPTTEPEALP